MSSAAAVDTDGPLAIICGGGTLPLTIADSVSRRGRPVVMFALRGHADATLVARYPHHWLRVGQFGAFARLAKLAGCRDVVLIGSLVRPGLWALRPDFGALLALPHIMRAYRGGDNHLLSGVARIFEGHGFRMLGAHEVAPEILVPEGALGRFDASADQRGDIAFGLSYLRASGAFDIGQAVVVARNRILAVEAAEGTDQMLRRIKELRATGRLATAAGEGVLVKAAKPGQDKRFDLPSIGPNTVAGVANAGMAGIGVVSGTTVIADPERTVHDADSARIFIVGISADTAQ